MILSYFSSPVEFARTHLAHLSLGDKRLNRRAEVLLTAFARHPGASIPRLFQGKRNPIDAAYAFFQSPKTSPEAVQAPHRSGVREAAKAFPVVLLVEDASEVSFPRATPPPGLGPVGRTNSTATRSGVLVHSVLAVGFHPAETGEAHRGPLAILGLLHQEYYTRVPRPEAETTRTGPTGRKKTAWAPDRERESQLWTRAGAAAGSPPEGAVWVRVADRGADIYEYLEQAEALGHQYVVRSCEDRQTQVTATQTQRAGVLSARLEQVSVKGQARLTLRGRDGRPSETLLLDLKVLSVCLRSPQRPGHAAGSLSGLSCSVLRATERTPPAHRPPLAWTLLTRCPVDTLDQAVEVLQMYSARWVIEEFHKALKTGMGAEKLQLETKDRLVTAMALMSLVAVRLVAIKEQARVRPQAGLRPVEIHVLQAVLRRPLETVEAVIKGIGALGGHMGRKRDGMPGLLTLWRGMKELQTLVEGFQLSSNNEFKT